MDIVQLYHFLESKDNQLKSSDHVYSSRSVILVLRPAISPEAHHKAQSNDIFLSFQAKNFKEL